MRLPQILGIEASWRGRVVFLAREMPGRNRASFQAPDTIRIGAECLESDAELTAILAHELTHALSRGQWMEELPSAVQDGVASWVGSMVANDGAAWGDWYPPEEDVREMILISGHDYALLPDQTYIESVARWYVQVLGLDYLRECVRSGRPLQAPSVRYRVTYYDANNVVLAETTVAGLPFEGSVSEGAMRSRVVRLFIPGEPVMTDHY